MRKSALAGELAIDDMERPKVGHAELNVWLATHLLTTSPEFVDDLVELVADLNQAQQWATRAAGAGEGDDLGGQVVA
jgi:hypothetical protein